MAAELKPHGVSAIAITPGFLRSESMLEHFGVTESNWREAGKKDKNFLASESPRFVGRAVAVLAREPNLLAKSGQLFSSWEVARDYGITDADGSRPDWDSHNIDFSRHPDSLLDRLRTGAEIQLEWLERLRERTVRFLARLPSPLDARS